jgi:alanine dehydrogenase
MTRMSPPTLLLNSSQIVALLSRADYLDAVENTFRLHAEGNVIAPALMHANGNGGEFHIKSGGLQLDKYYFGVKSGAGFFGNPERHGLPAIRGTITLCDAETGAPLAIMDATEITRNRTAAASAVAAKYLARANSQTITICGAGVQGRTHLDYLSKMFPLRKAYLYSRNAPKAAAVAQQLSRDLEIDVSATQELSAALRESDICVTCTPARSPFLFGKDVPSGMFIAAVGADSPSKQELDENLVASSKVIVDILEQCKAVGELHHALRAGMDANSVHAELGQIVVGRKCGRTSESEVIIFDSTGTALQDVACAARAYRKAVGNTAYVSFDFVS